MKRHKFINGKIYHIYNRGNWKATVFIDKKDKEFFIRKLKFLATWNECNVLVLGYCLMPNHYHLLVQQGPKTSISSLMQRLCTSYGKHFNHKYSTVGHVFQGRFEDTVIETKGSYIRICNYLKNNPVKAKIVTNPDDFAWLYINEKFIWGHT